MLSGVLEAPVLQSPAKYRITRRTDSRQLRCKRRLTSASQQRRLTEEGDTKTGYPSIWVDDHQVQGKKRRREVEEILQTAREEPHSKRRRPVAEDQQIECDGAVVTHNDLVQAWVHNGSNWAEVLKNTTQMSDRPSRPNKRSASSSSSRDRSVSSNGSGIWWDNRHAEKMRDAGMIMDETEGIACAQECEELCKRLAECEEPVPDDWYLKEPGCRHVLRMASYGNESRVERDVPPIICPSSELLTARGYNGLEHIKEGLNAEWTACSILCKPQPKPDGSYGVSTRALTEEENEKLRYSTTAHCQGSIFQFIVRQAKRSDGSLIKAERQAMHNASVACNTMVELYESIGASQELDRQILAFSVSHNHEMVSIFAHYPVIGVGKKTFHRRLLYETGHLSLTSDLCRPYKIILGIFRHFFPRHLRRIKDALARRPEHSTASSPAQDSTDEDGLEYVSTPPSSQEGSQSKKASLASAVTLKAENERLRRELLSLRQMQQEQSAQQLEQSRQLKEEARQQRLLLEHQLEQVQEGFRQQRSLLECQLERMQEESRQQKEESRQQKEESRQQRDDFRQQLAQQNAIIDLLKRERRGSTSTKEEARNQ